MADTRISALTRLPEAGVSPTDLLPIADLSASETKAITAKDLLEGVVINMDAGSIPAAKIDFSAGLASSLLRTTGGDVVLGRAGAAGVVQELSCRATGRAVLAAASVTDGRAALGLGSLAERSGSWVDGSSFSGTSSGVNTGDQTIVLTGAVTGTGTGTFATTIATGAVGSAQLAAGAVVTAGLADGSVVASKLADQSSSVVLTSAPSTAGAFVGQGAFNTVNQAAYTYTSTGWVEHAGIKTLTFNEVNTPLAFAVSGTNASTVDVTLDVQAPHAVWAGPVGGTNAAPTFRALVGADLPLATAAAVGAIKPGAGVSVAADGVLNVAKATATTLGGVVVPAGALSVAADGKLTHNNSGVTAGSYAKVTVDALGHVTAGGPLLAADVPQHDASLLVSGTLPAARIGNRSITAGMLADYSTALIQETVPLAGVNSHPIGMIWLQESTGQVSVWNGNSWMKTGASTLFNRNLRYGGSYNAATGLVTGVTQFGTAEGVNVGDPIPTADDKIAGLYFVAAVGGSSAGLANGAAFDPGDWLLCHGTTAGWVRIDTLNGVGGGGGGTVSNLDDLLDVTLTAPTQGDFLQLGGSNQWVNASVLDEGTWT